MQRSSIGRRSGAALTAMLAAAALTRCSPTVTDDGSGGGGGGGGKVAARVNITGQPSPITVGQTFSPAVRVVVADSDNFAITTSTAPVTISAFGSTTAPVAGTTTRNAVEGTAVMTGITIDTAGLYRLVATSPGLIPDTSDQFAVLPVNANTVTVEIGSDTAVNQVLFRSRRNHTVNPAIDTIAVGSTIKWIWLGNLSHGVLINAPPVIYSNGPSAAPDTAFLTINAAGTYNYLCSVHGNLMTGRIVVR